MSIASQSIEGVLDVFASCGSGRSRSHSCRNNDAVGVQSAERAVLWCYHPDQHHRGQARQREVPALLGSHRVGRWRAARDHLRHRASLGCWLPSGAEVDRHVHARGHVRPARFRPRWGQVPDGIPGQVGSRAFASEVAPVFRGDSLLNGQGNTQGFVNWLTDLTLKSL